MTKQILIIFLFLSSCTEESTGKLSNESASQDHIATVDSIPDSVLEKDNDGDTIFIKRELTSEYYHAIFIDTKRESKFYDWLTNFEFDKGDQEVYNDNYQYVIQKTSKSILTVNLPKIPKNWIPVYTYQEQYYLYAPSDWGNAGKRMINDSAFVFWYMDGPMPFPLTSIKHEENGSLSLEMFEPFQGELTTKRITIHTIDPNNGLSLFEYMNEPEEYRFRLYVPVENAKQFDMIVNYCNNRKQLEFEFDDIDFDKLPPYLNSVQH